MVSQWVTELDEARYNVNCSSNFASALENQALGLRCSISSDENPETMIILGSRMTFFLNTAPGTPV